MITPLNELSEVYLNHISEQEQTPEALKQRVAQMVKAIRYRARKEAVPISKAFNDYIGSVNATSVERQSVKERLGLTGGVQHKEEVEVPTGDIAKLARKASSRIDSDVSGSIDKKDSTDKTMGVFIPSPDGKKRIYGTKVKESSDYDPMDDDDFDHDEAEENRGVSGKNNPRGGKSLGKKKKSVKESFSNWRHELTEVVDELESERQIKEKKVKNKIIINPVMKEAIEELGGELIEMVEVDEAVYGGNKPKPTEPKDTRYVVTKADKTANTKAYQLYKSGDKRYKAADHLGEEILDDELEEGMSMKDFKQQRSRQKQKEKRAAEKLSPTRRVGIHNPEKSPERAARRDAAMGETGHGGPLRAKKVRKAKALGELGEEILDEKALSKQQQKFMGMVYAVKKGEMKAPSPEVAKAAAGMTTKQAKDFAKTKHKGLPEVKEQMDEPMGMGNSQEDDKRMKQEKEKIKRQRMKELMTRLQAARKGVY